MSSLEDEFTTTLTTNALELERVRRIEKGLKIARLELMVEGRGMGLSYQAIGDALNVTKAYVHQQIKAKESSTPVSGGDALQHPELQADTTTNGVVELPRD